MTCKSKQEKLLMGMMMVTMVSVGLLLTMPDTWPVSLRTLTLTTSNILGTFSKRYKCCNIIPASFLSASSFHKIAIKINIFLVGNGWLWLNCYASYVYASSISDSPSGTTCGHTRQSELSSADWRASVNVRWYRGSSRHSPLSPEYCHISSLRGFFITIEKNIMPTLPQWMILFMMLCNIGI